MIDKIKNYIIDVFAEMSKVTWPTVDELKESTVIVLAFSVVFAIAIYLFDTLFGMILKAIF